MNASALRRFRDAQAKPHAGFAAVLRELQAGRKTGHWIWYIFPQLAGLGQSPTAVYYGLAGAQEAADYLAMTATAFAARRITQNSVSSRSLDGC